MPKDLQFLHAATWYFCFLYSKRFHLAYYSMLIFLPWSIVQSHKQITIVFSAFAIYSKETFNSFIMLPEMHSVKASCSSTVWIWSFFPVLQNRRTVGRHFRECVVKSFTLFKPYKHGLQAHFEAEGNRMIFLFPLHRVATFLTLYCIGWQQEQLEAKPVLWLNEVADEKHSP